MTIATMTMIDSTANVAALRNRGELKHRLGAQSPGLRFVDTGAQVTQGG